MNALEQFLVKEAKFRPFTPSRVGFGATTPSLAPAQLTYDAKGGLSQKDEQQLWLEWKKSGKDPKKQSNSRIGGGSARAIELCRSKVENARLCQSAPQNPPADLTDP